MAIENTDLLVAYRNASSTHYKLSLDSLSTHITNNIDTLVYRGCIDVTIEKPAAFTTNFSVHQDFYVNTGSGVFHESWADVTSNAETGDPAQVGDFMIFNQVEYDHIPAGSPPSSDGIWVQNGDVISPANPNGRIDGGEYAT